MSALGSGARPVAGGTDLVVGARQGKASLPDAIVAIDRIESLKGIVGVDGGLRLGALVTHDEIVANEAIHDRFTALADASAIVGLPRDARARHDRRKRDERLAGDGHGRTAAVLRCFGDLRPSRRADGAAGELWTGPGTTVARPRELLVGIDLPAPEPMTGSAYVRLEYRRQMEIAVVGVTAVVTLDAGSVTHCPLAITALAPTIRRVPEAEAALAGSDGSDEAIAAAARAVGAGSSPITDVRGSAEYRGAMAEVIARRAIAAALARARGERVPIPASAAQPGATQGAA